jgi:hypothetical protein
MMARDKSRARPAPGPTFLKERPEYLERVLHERRGFENFDIDDFDWEGFVGVPFKIYWKARSLLRPLTAEENANLLNLVRKDGIRDRLVIGTLPGGERFLADGSSPVEDLAGPRAGARLAEA